MSDKQQTLTLLDGSVTAVITQWPDWVFIEDIQSKTPGEGNASAALAELRLMFLGKRFLAEDATRCIEFWTKMAERGLVDALTDNEGDDILGVEYSAFVTA